ncbi:MAG TPA: hypothetical protein VMA09_11525 [Candidatus Binataceae bacterium]|nr:hypothetical protein [Candidatus Binataceae bacterium]
MKPRNREVSIFNMSVLDLLTGALGAFCFLTLALFPYYFKATGASAGISSTDANQAKKAAEQLKEINLKLKSQLATAKANQAGMPPFAMASLFASPPNAPNSCGALQVTDYSGPGGQQAVKLLPTAGSNGYDTGLDLFLLAPGDYSITVTAYATGLPCSLWMTVNGATGQTQTSTVMNTTAAASYTLKFSVAAADLSFAQVMK